MELPTPGFCSPQSPELKPSVPEPETFRKSDPVTLKLPAFLKGQNSSSPSPPSPRDIPPPAYFHPRDLWTAPWSWEKAPLLRGLLLSLPISSLNWAMTPFHSTPNTFSIFSTLSCLLKQPHRGSSKRPSQALPAPSPSDPHSGHTMTPGLVGELFGDPSLSSCLAVFGVNRYTPLTPGFRQKPGPPRFQKRREQSPEAPVPSQAQEALVPWPGHVALEAGKGSS